MAHDIPHETQAAPPVTRRQFLVLTAGSVALAACGSGSEPEVERAAEKWFADQTVVADGTTQRTIWSLRDDDGNLADLAPASVGYAVLDGGGNEIASGTVDRHDDGTALPYYPVEVAFAEPGAYEFRFDAGDFGNHVGFAAPGLLDDSALLWSGDRFPSVVTPTFDNDAGVADICTRTDTCPYHEISLDSALVNGRPTLLLVSTPEFCGTVFMCGPVLEILIEEISATSPDIDVIHAEVYVDPQPDDLGDLLPVVEATGVTYEPFLFLIGADGRVVRRLDHIWDRTELRELLDAI